MYSLNAHRRLLELSLFKSTSILPAHDFILHCSVCPGSQAPDHPALVCGRNRPSVCSGVNTIYLPLTLPTAQSSHGALLRPTSASSGAYTSEAGRNTGRENMSFLAFPSDRTQKDPVHFLLFLFFRFPWKLQTLCTIKGVKVTNMA